VLVLALVVTLQAREIESASRERRVESAGSA